MRLTTCMWTKKYFITTPIFYVNSVPHIGHVYSLLLADAQNRFQKILGHNSLLTTGTDEHGLKIQQASEKNGFSDPQQFCDSITDKFEGCFRKIDSSHDDFVRTTDERHAEAVKAFWGKLNSDGYISKQSYESWYCVQDESFLTEHQIDLERKVSLESGHPVEWAEEENYVFKLEPFRERIAKWLDDQDVIKPSIFKGHLQMFLSDEMPDLSVSRPRSRLKWGIPVPGDDSQTIYVWLDALVNYLTVSGYPELDQVKRSWPPDCHVIGKDILKFHAIYWPSFLMAAGLELPRRILCHSHWMVNDEKMSKSKGNVIDPNDLMEKFSSEGLRYILLREGVPHSDGNYADGKMVNYLNNELANTLGNLLSRTTGAKVNIEQKFYSYKDINPDLFNKEARELMDYAEGLTSIVCRHYSDFNYYQGIDAIVECLRRTNAYVQNEKPWELKKTNPERLKAVLCLSLESLRVCGILLQPIVPNLAKKLLDKLNVNEDHRLISNAASQSWNSSDDNNSSRDLSPQETILYRKIRV